MTETRTIIVCVNNGTFWHPDVEPPKCSNLDHDHPRFEMHRHRDIVELPDETKITAVSFDTLDPYTRPEHPDFGLYLDHQWNPPWPHAHLDWPDFGVPDDPTSLITALTNLHQRARSGDRVELGCHGGHGRTGTALAALAVLCGKPAQQAIDWVRTTYCHEAIETEAQQAFVAELQARLNT